MATLKACLFGKFCVHYDEHLLEGLEARKAQELLCYLLLYRDRPHPRETLAGLLWGDSPAAQSKKNLRQALWQLQAALASLSEATNTPFLLIEPDWVQLNTAANLWVDVNVFEQAVNRLQGVPGEALDRTHAQGLQDALNLYQGELLDGWYQDWCLYERERLQNKYLLALDKLMGYCEVHSEYEDGLAYGEQILRYDRARERTHRRLMRLHYSAGERTMALRQYARCVAALEEELGVKPSQRTEDLYKWIQADTLIISYAVWAKQSATAAPSDYLAAAALGKLRQFQTSLADVQRQVRQDIQTLETALSRERSTSQ